MMRLSTRRRSDPMVVQHRGSRWSPDEDRRLLEMLQRGKSWIFIAANLKRPVKTVEYRAAVLRARPAVNSLNDG
jgi:hypothetical protein